MTTITRFTKEQLIARADHLLCVGKAFIAEHPEYDGMAKDVELFKIALASLEADPVAGEARFKEEHHWSPCTAAHVAMVLANPSGWPNYDVRYLYAATPAPVVDCVPLGDSTYDVPYSMPSNLRELIAEEIGILFSDDDAQSVWNVCRSAAMLN
ncbi:hypothetical protein WDR94_000507 [Citrobacter amalonaticus]